MPKERRRSGDRKLDLLELLKSRGASRQAIEMAERIRAANLESPPNAPKLDTSDLLGEALRHQIWGPAGPPRKPPKPGDKKPAEPKKAWREKPTMKAVEAAMVEVAKGFPSAEKYLPNAARPAFAVILAGLRTRCGQGVTVRQAKAALQNRAPHLSGRPGHRAKR
jgi:hypothetical protein